MSLISKQYWLNSAVIKMIPQFYRKIIRRPCINCVLKIFLKSSLICGIATKSKCCHGEEKMCSFRPSLLAAVVSMVLGFLSLAVAIYELCVSVNENIRFWEFENVQVFASFSFALAESLASIYLAKRHKIFASVLGDAQNLISALIATSSGTELQRDLLKLRFQSDFTVLFSICTSISAAVYRSSNFITVSFLRSYLSTHLTLGLSLTINICLTILSVNHTNLKTTLKSMLAKRNLHFGDFSPLRKQFHLIMDLQFFCYKLLNKLNKSFSFAFLLYFANIVGTLYFESFIRIARMLKGDIYGTIHLTPFFLRAVLLNVVIGLHHCYLGNKLMRANESVICFIHLYRTRLLPNEDIHRLETLLEVLKTQEFKIKISDHLSVCNKVYAECAYLIIMHILVGLQFYLY